MVTLREFSMWKTKLFNYFAQEAITREVPLALLAAYVNERVHYKLLCLQEASSLPEEIKAAVYIFFPITEAEGLNAHLLKAKCSVLAAEEDCSWHDLIITKLEQKNVVRARHNFAQYAEVTRVLFKDMNFEDIDMRVYYLLVPPEQLVFTSF